MEAILGRMGGKLSEEKQTGSGKETSRTTHTASISRTTVSFLSTQIPHQANERQATGDLQKTASKTSRTKIRWALRSTHQNNGKKSGQHHTATYGTQHYRTNNTNSTTDTNQNHK